MLQENAKCGDVFVSCPVCLPSDTSSFLSCLCIIMQCVCCVRPISSVQQLEYLSSFMPREQPRMATPLQKIMEFISTNPEISLKGDDCNYDKSKEVKAFDETKAGVKGLVDSGLSKIPKFFIHPPESLQKSSPDSNFCTSPQVPVVNFEGFESFRRMKVVDEVREASETWGFFQIVNHGIPGRVMDEMIAGVRRFHEQAHEVKMEWYSRDKSRRVRFFCNGDLLVSKAPANWRDAIAFEFLDGELDPGLFPETCREAVREYIKHIDKLRRTLSELLSEALGLPGDYLSGMECMETESLVCHYYPSCPQPDLTLGATKHTDPAFLTVLLQDNMGGLQVLHQGQWVDVSPQQGALVVNIGDFMQLITNDKFRSVEHRVLAGRGGPRISVACFFYPSSANNFKPYGAIRELLANKPSAYRETHITEFMAYFRSKGLDGNSALSHFKLV